MDSQLSIEIPPVTSSSVKTNVGPFTPTSSAAWGSGVPFEERTFRISSPVPMNLSKSPVVTTTDPLRVDLTPPEMAAKDWTPRLIECRSRSRIRSSRFNALALLSEARRKRYLERSPSRSRSSSPALAVTALVSSRLAVETKTHVELAHEQVACFAAADQFNMHLSALMQLAKDKNIQVKACTILSCRAVVFGCASMCVQCSHRSPWKAIPKASA